MGPTLYILHCYFCSVYNDKELKYPSLWYGPLFILFGLIKDPVKWPSFITMNALDNRQVVRSIRPTFDLFDTCHIQNNLGNPVLLLLEDVFEKRLEQAVEAGQ